MGRDDRSARRAPGRAASGHAGQPARAMLKVAVQVHPGASRDRVELRPDGGLEIWLRARAVEGRANAALVALLADRLGVRRSGVSIVRGERARHKLVALDLDSPDELARRLAGDRSE